MLDYEKLWRREVALAQFVADLTVADLRLQTNEMIDQMLHLISSCIDDDVVFEPVDERANDPYASDEDERHIAWTLGHVIVHTTASAEESASLASELARGVPFHGRSRSELPWHEVNTIDLCRFRLEESRRMRLASLDMWPAQPDLENNYQTRSSGPVINALGRFILGLTHDFSHLEQIGDIVEQAQSARTP